MKYSVVFPAGCPFAAFVPADYSVNSIVRGVYRVRQCVAEYNAAAMLETWTGLDNRVFTVDDIEWFDDAATVDIVNGNDERWTAVIIELTE